MVIWSLWPYISLLIDQLINELSVSRSTLHLKVLSFQIVIFINFSNQFFQGTKQCFPRRCLFLIKLITTIDTLLIFAGRKIVFFHSDFQEQVLCLLFQNNILVFPNVILVFQKRIPHFQNKILLSHIIIMVFQNGILFFQNSVLVYWN